jgi:hypothetical protein
MEEIGDLSFIPMMKDKTNGGDWRFVLHAHDEGQNEWRSLEICPSYP